MNKIDMSTFASYECEYLKVDTQLQYSVKIF